MNIWWKFVQNNPKYINKASAIVTLLCGAQPKQLQRNLISCKFECLLCKSRVKDDVYHVVIDCTKTTQARDIFWSRIYDNMPLAMRMNLQEMRKKQVVDFILSGLGERYLREWDDIYVNIVLQIWELYQNRALEIDKMLLVS